MLQRSHDIMFTCEGVHPHVTSVQMQVPKIQDGSFPKQGSTGVSFQQEKVQHSSIN